MKKIITEEEKKELINKEKEYEAERTQLKNEYVVTHRSCICDSIGDDIDYISKKLQEIKEKLNRTVYVIDNDEKKEFVDVNDIVRVKISLNGEEIDEYVVQLVGATPKLLGNYDKITTESPMGAAIYGKMPGDVVNYLANGKTFTAEILEKIDEINKENDDNKNLTK